MVYAPKQTIKPYIKKLADDGFYQWQIAQSFNVSQTSIHKALKQTQVVVY